MPIPAGSGSGPTPAGLSYEPVLSRVRLSVSGLSPASYAVVERSTDQVRWAAVRGAAEVAPTGGGVAVDDYEFTPDVVNYYRVRAYTSGDVELGPALNGNPYLETDASGWTAVGGTVARSTAQAHEGVGSLLLTPDGVTAQVEARATNVPVTTGKSYRMAAWVRSTVARTVSVAIRWRDSVGTLLTTTSVPASLSAGVWTLVVCDGVAPASATQATPVAASMSSTPPAGNTVYVDEAHMAELGAGPVFAGTITPAIGGVWLKSIARPFLNRQVVVVDYSDVERPSRAGVFDVVGRSLPVSVSDVRGSRRWTLEVLANTLDAADDLDLLLASGDTLLVQVPAGSGVPAGYVEVGDTRQRRTSRLGPRRVLELHRQAIRADLGIEPSAQLVALVSGSRHNGALTMR